MDYNTISNSLQDEISDIKSYIERYLESDIELIEKAELKKIGVKIKRLK